MAVSSVYSYMWESAKKIKREWVKDRRLLDFKHD